MKFLHAFLLTTLVLALAACGKNDAVTSEAATTAPVPSVATASETLPGSAAPAAVLAAESSAPTEVVEEVAETEEAAEATIEPAAKGSTPPLKLAQIPPRVPAASRFKEGVHYMRLSPTQPVDVSPDQVQVVEFFWYGCPHCNALDPHLEAWRKSAQPGGKPDYVVFSRLPGAWNDIARFHGRFFFAAESLGKLDELHPLLFDEIHKNNNPLNSIDKAREFFAAHGVDAQAFQKNFGAMALERKLDNAYTLAQRYRVTGVPFFIINGKFTTDVAAAGGEDQLLALLNELAAREHARE